MDTAATLLCREDYESAATTYEAAGQIPSAAREVYELMCVTEGSAECWVEDQHYKLKPGDVLLISVGVMVSTTFKSRGCPFHHYRLWMSRRYMACLMQHDKDAGHCFDRAVGRKCYVLRLSPEQFGQVADFFAMLSEECLGDGFCAELSAKAALSALIVQLSRLVAGQGDKLLQAGEEHRLAPVLSHIHKNCTTQLSVEGLAEQFEYSPSHLAHSFKKQMGTSLYHYVLLRRLQIGREAMLAGTPVKEAYQRCGFGDYAGFYRAFTKEFGFSPQQYKKRNQWSMSLA